MDHDDPNWTVHFALVPHPDFPPPPGVSFTAAAGREGGALHLHFSQCGDENDKLILLQPPYETWRQDGLWKHTCFEAFVRTADELSYVELNFTNWGEFAAYSFEDRRSGKRNIGTDDERVGWLQYKGDGGDGVYHRSYATLPIFKPSKVWHVGLSAVIEAKDGTRSYWALAHAPGPPDFHNPACFVATLPAPDAA